MLTTIALAGCAVYLLFLLFRTWFTYLYDVPGPSRPSLLWGNLGRILSEETGVAHREWLDKYGGVIRYTGFWGQQRLVVGDPAALNHILLSRAYDYPKPNEVRGSLGRVVGKGLIFAEGDDHRRQKRIIQPAFSPIALRELVPVFLEKSEKLKMLWNGLLDTSKSDREAFTNEAAANEYLHTQSKHDGEVMLEMSKQLSRVTLDIIGVAGFGYEFDSLENENNKLGQSINLMGQGSGRRMSLWRMLVLRTLSVLINVFPILQKVPNERIRAFRQGFEVAELETRRVLETKRREMADAKAAGEEIKGRDLISLLLKSNAGEAKNQMTDAELQGQMTTFALAGHETTATALTWLFWRLAKRPEIQKKLRDEIKQATEKARAENRSLTADDIQSLEYLDACTREIMRLEPPVSMTVRTSKVHDVVPLSKPVQSKRPGKTIDSFPIRPDQQIIVPIVAINKSQKMFGEDADEFRPERWLDGSLDQLEGRKEKGEDGSSASGTTAGIWSGLMTFLAGPRACIGYRFALLEFKTIVCVLLPSFEFLERDDKPAIDRRSIIVTRPVIVGEEDLGPRMPLKVRRVS